MIFNETSGLVLAFLFGLVFDWWTHQPQRDSGFIALWVVFGVSVTLLISALVPDVAGSRLALYWFDGKQIVLSNHTHAVVWVLKFFIASGIPVTLGSLLRYVQTLGNGHKNGNL